MKTRDSWRIMGQPPKDPSAGPARTQRPSLCQASGAGTGLLALNCDVDGSIPNRISR